ncbi:MAG: SpoIIE family protein phosphatase, partial [Actinomycetota bacterium]
GHEAGEVASRIAVDRIRSSLSDDTSSVADAAANARAGESGPDEPVTSRAANDVIEAVRSANGDIFRAAITNPSHAGMGTTVTAIAVIEDPLAGRGEPNIDDNDPVDRGPDGEPRTTPVTPRQQPEALVLANVGDSRTYLFRHGRLRRVTVDHNYVQELVASGHITDDEARFHPRRNIITRALGIEPDVTVDWWTLPLVKGDRYLLCSDGLVDEVTDAEITAALSANADPQQAVEVLIDQANEAGGRDNITIVVVDVLHGEQPPEPTQELDVVPSWADDRTEPTPRDLLGDVDGYVAPDDGDLAVVPIGSLSRKERRAIARREKAAARERRRAAKRRGAPAPTDVADATDSIADAPVGGDESIDHAADEAADAGDGPEPVDAGDDTDAAASGAVTDVAMTDGAGSADDVGEPGSTGSGRRTRGRRWLAVAAIVVVASIAGGIAAGAWARRGYYVDFDDGPDGGEVTVYQGRRGGVLWIEPTVAARGPLDRDQLVDGAVDAVLEQPRFESLDDAVDFVRGLDQRTADENDDADPTDDADPADDPDPTGDADPADDTDTEPTQPDPDAAVDEADGT